MLQLKVKKFLLSFAVVMLVSSVLTATGAYAYFGDLINTGSKIFTGMRDIVFAVSGFGIVAVAVGGFFGTINYKWLSAIIIGLMVIALTAAILNFMAEEKGGATFHGITDTLINADDTARSASEK